MTHGFKCIDCDYVFKVTLPLTRDIALRCKCCHTKQKLNKNTLELTLLKRDHRRPKTPNWNKGPGYCRWCGTDIRGKDGNLLKRRRWCSDKCIEDYKNRTDASWARRFIFQRDQGICAQCGIETQKPIRHYRKLQTRVLRIYKWLSERERNEKDLQYYQYAPDAERWKVRVETLMYKKYGLIDKVKRNNVWHLDHIIPLIDGGSHDPDNMQTLCEADHKKKTALEAGLRAKRKKENN